MSLDRIKLPEDGICPCGSKDLLLAKDQTEYTPLHKEGGVWEYDPPYVEELDQGLEEGSVRLFCPACGQYFFVPKELT